MFSITIHCIVATNNINILYCRNEQYQYIVLSLWTQYNIQYIVIGPTIYFRMSSCFCVFCAKLREEIGILVFCGQFSLKRRFSVKKMKVSSEKTLKIGLVSLKNPKKPFLGFSLEKKGFSGRHSQNRVFRVFSETRITLKNPKKP